MYYSAAAAAAG